MKIIYKFIAIGFALMPVLLGAQVKPEYFPDDVDANMSSAQIRCYCKPGVRNKSRSKGLEVIYNFVGKGTYEPESESFPAPYSTYMNWQSWRVTLKVPILNRPGLKLLAGYRYVSESFAFDHIGDNYRETFQTMDRKIMQSNSLDIMGTKSFNEKHYLVFRLRNSSNGNYSGVQLYNKRYNIFKVLAMYGLKPNEDFEWGVGLNLSHGFRQRTSLLPFILYNRNFNDKWAVESALPAFIFIRRNINMSTLLLAGLEYNSQSYRLDIAHDTAPLDYAYNHAELIASIQMERQIAPWVWANLKLGYQYNLSSDFESKSHNSAAFRVEPTNAVFLHVGIFLSPPERYVK